MRAFSGITFRLNIFLIGLLAMSAIGLTIVMGTLSSRAFEAHVRQVTFPALMENIMGMVNRELLAPAGTLETLAKNPFFIDWIAEGGSEAQAPQVFAMGREVMNTHRTGGLNVVLRDSLRFFSLDGQTEKVFVTDKARDSWFFAFEESGKPLWVNVHAADDPLYPGMAFFNRRIEQDGKFAGIISTGMKIEAFSNAFVKMRIGQRGTTMLARPDGSLLIHPDKQMVGKSIRDLPGYAEASSSILAGRATTFDYVNAAGERLLVMAQPVPVLDLFLVSEANLDEMTAGINEAMWYAIGIGFALVVLGGIVGSVLMHTITNPLKSIISIAEDVTRRQSTGDASLPEAYHRLAMRKDELGVLATALGEMVHSLQEASVLAHEESVRAQEESNRVREAMNEVAVSKKDAEERTNKLVGVGQRLVAVADVVSVASLSLKDHVHKADDSARQQADHISETAAAMNEMTATVLEVAKNAAVASDASSLTRQHAETGADIVRRAVKSITRVQEQSSALKVDMERLGENAQGISQIMGVISDIADQTNLLALNAAIEAARAGEAGRGFAVVADEVRKLAEKTMVSTVDVDRAIRTIQQNATNSLARMDDAVQSIEEATLLAAESGTALDEIVRLADNTAGQVHAIATAAEKQSATSEQVNQSIGQVSDSSRSTSQAMRDASQAVIELAGQAHELSTLIDEIKTS